MSERRVTVGQTVAWIYEVREDGMFSMQYDDLEAAKAAYIVGKTTPGRCIAVYLYVYEGHWLKLTDYSQGTKL